MKSPFASWMDRFSVEQPEQVPQRDPADSKNWGNWCGVAEQILLKKDHLFQVATITKGQIKKLNQAGINTMQQLADLTRGLVSGINPIVLEKLKSQAAIQKLSAGGDKILQCISITMPITRLRPAVN